MCLRMLFSLGIVTWLLFGSGQGAHAQDAIVEIETITVEQGSATLAEVELYVTVTAGLFNGVSITLASTLPIDSIVLEPTFLGVTPDSLFSVGATASIIIDDDPVPVPLVAPFGPVLFGTALIDTSSLAAGEFASIDASMASIDPTTALYTPIILRGGVFADGNNASQLYFTEPDDDMVHRVLLDASGSVLSTTPFVLDRVVSVAVDANNIAWLPEFNAGGDLYRYNGTTELDVIPVGPNPGAIAIDRDGAAWVGLRFDGTISKVSASGQVLYGPGGALGAGFPVLGRPISMSADPFGFVWVLTLDPMVAGNGQLVRFGPDGEVAAEVLFTNGEVARKVVVDGAGYAWVSMSNEVRILSSDGSTDASIAYPGLPDNMTIRRATTAQAGVVPGGFEAWAGNGGTAFLRRVRRDGVFTLSLAGSCSFGGFGGVHVDGEGQVWALNVSGGCAVSVDASGTGAPVVLEELTVPFTGTGVSVRGDASGYFQAMTVQSSTGDYADLDSDTITNRAELRLGTNPFVANGIIVPPVTDLTCTDMGGDVVVTWTNGAPDYASVFVCVNGTENELAGTETSFTIRGAGEDVYFFDVQGFNGVAMLRSAGVSCQVVIGPGEVIQKKPVGLSIFDVTATGLPAPSPAYFVTDTGTDTILALDEDYEVIESLGNPFSTARPRGIAFDPGVLPGPIAPLGPNETIIVTGSDQGTGIQMIRIDLTGTPTTGEVELRDETGSSFTATEASGGLAHDHDSRTAVMVGPTGCVLLSYDTTTIAPLGPGPLDPILVFDHPAPASSLNGVEVESFGPAGGVAWLSQNEGNEFVLQRVAVSAVGDVTVQPETLTLGAIDEEISFGGFSFSPEPTDDLVAVVGVSTSTLYAIGGIEGLLGVPFDRGDCNDDGQFDIGDAITVLSYLFSGAMVPCEDACDSNDDGAVDIGDGIYNLSALFSSGPLPAAPHGTCGLDPTPDATECAAFTGCS